MLKIWLFLGYMNKNLVGEAKNLSEASCRKIARVDPNQVFFGSIDHGKKNLTWGLLVSTNCLPMCIVKSPWLQRLCLQLCFTSGIAFQKLVALDILESFLQWSMSLSVLCV